MTMEMIQIINEFKMCTNKEHKRFGLTNGCQMSTTSCDLPDLLEGMSQQELLTKLRRHRPLDAPISHDLRDQGQSPVTIGPLRKLEVSVRPQIEDVHATHMNFNSSRVQSVQHL